MAILDRGRSRAILFRVNRTSEWMEAIPLSDMSAVACAKALIFSRISGFGVPKTIISNIWSQLCEMLHISHCQTTAYHPESKGAVEILHRRLKDALLHMLPQ